MFRLWLTVKTTPAAISIVVLVLLSLLLSLFPAGLSFQFATTAYAAPNAEINYQGKLTDSSGVAVPNGTYNMRFWLLQSTSQATTSAIWTESLTGSDQVQVTNGLFSVMLGSSSPLTSVDFNQDLFLGVEIGGTGGTPSWDGEMLPRKPLGTVPAAFESFQLGGVASSSFLRSDQADTAGSLITFDGGLISTASSTLTDVTLGTATATTLNIGGDSLTELVGTGLINNNGTLEVSSSSLNLTLEGLSNVDTTNVASGDLLQFNGTSWATTSTSSLGIDGSADDLTDNSIEDLSDVTAMTKNFGDLFYWNGTAWADIATSSLGLGNGTFLGLSDTPGSYTTNAIPFVSGGNSLAFDSTFVYDGTNLGIGTASPGAMLDIFGTSNALRLSYDGSNYAELSTNASGILSITSTGGTGSGYTVGSGLAEDTFMLYDGNALDYYLGLDDTDDRFKIGLGATVGTDSLLELSSGTTTITNALYVSSSTATSTFANGIQLEGGCFRTADGNCLETAGDTVVVVAASDSPANEKAYADYVADGTSDEVEIQQAINYVYANGGGGTVHLLAGQFNIGADVSLASSTSVVGQGDATVLRLANGASVTYGLLYAQNAEYVYVGHLRLEGNSAGVFAGALSLETVASSTFEYLTINDFGGNAVATNGSRYNVFQHSVITNINNNGVHLISSPFNTIRNNLLSDVGGVGVYIQNSSGNVRVESNEIYRAGGVAAIYVHPIANNTRVSGNTVVDATNNALYIEGSDTLVSNNIFIGNTGNPLVLNAGNNTHLVGNTYADPGATTLVSDFGTNTRYNEWDRTTITTDDARGYNLFSIVGSTTATSAAITQLGTGDIFTLDNASGRQLTVTNGGFLGLGTTSPSSKLSVAGNVWLDSNVINFASSSASSLLLQYFTNATSTIKDNTAFAFTIATSSDATPIFRIDTNGTYPKVVLDGDFEVGGGALSYNSATNQTSIENLALGSMTFADDAGSVTWANMGVTTASATGTVMSYSAALDSTPLLTIFGKADGQGGVASTSVGIGTTSPSAKLSLQNTNFSGAGVVGFDQYLQTANSVLNAVQLGNNLYINASNTATTTLVGSLYRIADNTELGNTVRGIEIQANKGENTQGENTALSLFGRTFGVRAVTTGEAGNTFEPAAGFFETEGSVQGNAIRGYSDTITTATLMALFHSSSTFEGTGLEMSFGNGTGDFSSTTSKYLDFQNGGSSVFTVSAFGTTTIGNGSDMASLHIGFGGICVDNDGSCTATSTGWVVADGFAAGNSDLAETYFSSTALEPGEIVVMTGGLSIDRAAKESMLPVLGVVSTNPGLTIGSDDQPMNEGESGYPVALSGRVPVKLSTENGPIKKGDQLMLSSLPGIAMKATGTGATIGIALEDFDDTRYYSDTYLNQFADSLVEPNYEPVFTVYDPRIDDGCYYGGGNAIGEDPCVPLVATTDDEIVEEANTIAEQQSVEEQLQALYEQESETIELDGDMNVQVGQIVMFVEKGYRWATDAQLAGLQALMSTTSIEVVGEREDETIFDRLVALANRFVDGVLSVLTLKADRVETSELCVDGVCVTADDLRTLLDGQAAAAATSGGSTDSIGGGSSTTGDDATTDGTSTGGNGDTTTTNGSTGTADPTTTETVDQTGGTPVTGNETTTDPTATSGDTSTEQAATEPDTTDDVTPDTTNSTSDTTNTTSSTNDTDPTAGATDPEPVDTTDSEPKPEPEPAPTLVVEPAPTQTAE